MYQISLRIADPYGVWIPDLIYIQSTNTHYLFRSTPQELESLVCLLENSTYTGSVKRLSEIKKADFKPLLTEYKRLRNEFDNLGQALGKLLVESHDQ